MLEKEMNLLLYNEDTKILNTYEGWITTLCSILVNKVDNAKLIIELLLKQRVLVRYDDPDLYWRKPTKLCAQNYQDWVIKIQRTHNCTESEATLAVVNMISNKTLILSEM